MNNHPETLEPAPRGVVDSPVDSGSQALSEALRSSFSVLKFLMVVLLLVFVFSGVFTVGPEKRAIILRLGKPVGEGEQALLGPGLHLSFPYPIDQHEIISISGIQRMDSTVGWYATTPEMELAGTEPPPGGSLNPAADGYAITADGNIIHTRATLTYRIHDPITYVFNFVNASNAIQNALNNALLYAASKYKVDDILTRDVIGFNETVRRRVTELVERHKLGIQVEQCTARSIPPRQLKDPFDNVLKAEVTRSKLLDDSRSYENQTLSKASAEAQSRVNAAHSDRARLVNDVKSQAERFKDVLPRYQANPGLFVQQRLLDTVGRVLTNAQDKFFIPEGSDGKTKEIRYILNRDLPRPGTNAPPR